MTGVRLSLRDVKDFATAHTIENAYDALGYSYLQECEYENNRAHSEERARFVERLYWIREPTSDLIRRFFNQLNAFYAEQWALSHIEVDPLEFLDSCNRLVLYRQGKRLGQRLRPMQFGVRRDLDVLDPRRHFQLVSGISPSLLSGAIESWATAVSCAWRHLDSVIALTMALIAIHPYTDGNGRVARIAFSWLNTRYGLEALWLAEAEDGEFLRVGSGLKSTEHLMGMFVLQLCANYNSVSYIRDTGSSDRDKLALQALKENLISLGQPAAAIVAADAFRELRTHLHQYGHLQHSSTRFAALRNVLN